jgi:2-(1,2-epoxy-1,2-dihydrophenyl)acetyl-CoA isomerase
MSEPNVLYETRGAVALVTLNRPKSLNSFTRAMHQDLWTALAMACDLAIAAPEATFIQAFSKIGLIPDAGGTWFLVKKLGVARAMGCALLGDKLSAQDAKEWGMIWDVAPQGQGVVDAALALAQRMATMPTKALVATRALVRGAASNSLDVQLDLERDTQSALGRTHDYIEGVKAFLEKRPPAFKGE